MGSAAVIVEQDIAGQLYETVHGAQSELDLVGEDGVPSEAFLLELFGGTLPGDLFGSATDPTSEFLSPGDFGLVGSIITLHRYLQAKICRLTRIYITDGRKSSGGAAPIFYSLPIDLACRGIGMSGDADQSNVGPVNQAMLIDKVPKGFGQRGGRIFMRGCFQNDQLRVGGVNGVEIVPTVRTALEARLGLAINISQIDSFYDSGDEADQASVYAILNYRTKAEYSANPALKGQVKGSTGVTSLRFGGATGRQTNRPSKRA